MLQDLIPYIEYIRCNTALTTDIESGVCMACGGLSPFSYTEVINSKLAKQWELSAMERRGMSARESRYCAFCGSSARLRNLALAISLTLGWKQNGKHPLPLRQLIKKGSLSGIKVAEINSCGVLHDILKETPNLSYSEYAPVDKTVLHQDLMSLTYKDESFDLVLTSDTLEHVPNPTKALSEIYRVLKKGGYHIFTVPAFLNKRGRNRVVDNNGKPRYLAPKPYHGSGESDYLVWNEFGHDFIDTVRSVGFDLKVYFLNVAHLDDPCYVFVACRPKDGNRRKDSKQKGEYMITADPTLPLTDRPSKYINVRVQNESAAHGSDVDRNTQIELLDGLLQKFRLTEAHVQNLEDIIKDQRAAVEKLTHDFKTVEAELRAVYESKSWKLVSKAAAAKGKLKGR